MIKTTCAICGTEDNARILYQERLGHSLQPDSYSFSARRSFDSHSRIHHRFVQCHTCSLIRSDPIFESDRIAALYQDSAMLYSADTKDISRTYGRYLKKAIALIKNPERLLDIGCGDGFFLKHAMTLGFKDVYGVEPSRAIYDSLDSFWKSRIISGNFTGNLFPQNHFDVVCLFQVIEHVIYPNETIAEIFRILRPGGIFLVISHNAASLSVKLLGEQSPIFDIVHINLFDKRTLPAIIARHHFAIQNIYNVLNSYSFKYWFNYAGLNPGLKRAIINIADRIRLSNIKIPLWAGNIAILAQKPADSIC
jgi:SAM-dependent methyltransferase